MSYRTRSKFPLSALALLAGFMSSGLHAQLTDADREVQRAMLAGKEPVVPKFAINEFQIEGNTLLPQQVLLDAVAPFLGKSRDFGDVQQALEALEAIYKKRNYSTVSVLLPEQVLESGVVQLRIVEGKIRKINVVDNKHFSSENILASLPPLKPGAVPIMADISASLRVANENPGKKVTLAVENAEDSDDIDAKLTVVDQVPWTVGLSLDNTGSDQTGIHRLGLTLQHSNLFDLDHVGTFQYQTSPEKPDSVNVYVVAYRIPFYGLGDVLDLYASKSSVNAGFVAAGPFNLAITGSGDSYGAKYAIKLKRRGAYDHELTFGLDIKKFDNSIAAGTLELGNQLQVNPLSIQYSGRYSSEGNEIGGNIALAHNIPGGEFGRQDAFDKARTGASMRYVALRGGLNYSRALPDDWQARAVLTGQYAAEPLIPGEQFGIGGASSVRGFDEREVSNDKGIQGNLEIYSPDMCTKWLAGSSCRAIAFYDWGTVKRISPLAGEAASESIASTGLGLRLGWGKDLAFQADYGYVLQGGGSRNEGDWKLHARLGYFF
jgi:hemolysin activation/secretion protein